MAKFEIIMPKLGESIIEATITRWVKNVGDQLEEDDSIVEIATDKVDSEIPSPIEGKLVEVLFEEGDIVAVGTVIAVVDMDGEDSEDTTKSDEPVKEAENNPEIVEETAPKTTKVEASVPSETKVPDFSGSDRFYSPLVKSIAKQEHISIQELDGIKGSGKNGRVTKK